MISCTRLGYSGLFLFALATQPSPAQSGDGIKDERDFFETRVRRTVYPITSGTSKIELSVDKGRINAGDQSAALCEVELELKRGDPRQLFRLAHQLAGAHLFLAAMRSSGASSTDLPPLLGSHLIPGIPM